MVNETKLFGNRDNRRIDRGMIQSRWRGQCECGEHRSPASQKGGQSLVFTHKERMCFPHMFPACFQSWHPKNLV